ncbi:MAG: PLP-dependent aminotransferase family protein [Lachnospiraceae bacterium]
MKYAECVSRFAPSDIRNKLFDRPDIISLAAGKPDDKVFPYEEIKKSIEKVQEKDLSKALQYSSTYGIQEIRELIANKVVKSLGADVTADMILMTSGSQQGIYFSASIFLNKGDVVICEEPSYTGALNIFNALGAECVGVKMDEDGMNMESLREILEKTPNAGMIYTIPDFQNPSASIMSVEKRKELVKLAKEFDIPIVEDSPYSELAYDQEKLPCLKHYDEDGHVILLGTFSKTLCPGLRLGWVCASPEILEKYSLIKTLCDLQVSTLNEYIVADYLANNDWEKRLDYLRDFYRSKRDAMWNSIEKYFPSYVKTKKPHGGFFVWIELGEDMDSQALVAKAAEAGVAFISGTNFFTRKDKKNCIRLNFSWMAEDKIEEGIKRLGKVLTEEGE